jgi:hypothetical protein
MDRAASIKVNIPMKQSLPIYRAAIACAAKKKTKHKIQILKLVAEAIPVSTKSKS